MKKTIVAIVIVASVILIGCRETEKKEETKKAVTVEFEYVQTEEDYQEYAVIKGKDKDDAVVWELETAKNPLSILEQVREIGVKEENYYYQSSEGIFAVKVSDGSLVWQNKDAIGENFLWGENGNLYVTGEMAYGFYAIDRNGKTLHAIENFGPNYRSISDMEIENDKIMITMLKDTDSGEEVPVTCIVDLKDYSYMFQDL